MDARNGSAPDKPAGSGRRAAAIGLLALTIVPLSPLLFYLPYALRGMGKYAFYEFGGYFELYFITPAIGLCGALVFPSAAFVGRRRPVVLWYGISVGLMLIGYLIAGLTDCIPDFGE